MATPPVMATLPSATVVPLPAPTSQAPSTTRSDEATAIRPRPVPAQVAAAPAPAAGGSKIGIVLSVLAIVAVIGLAVFMLLPKKGSLSIDIKSKSGAPVSKAEIFVDGQKKCDITPCKVADLDPGPKVVKVLVPDSAPADPVVATVEAGKDVAVLVPVDGAPAPAPVPAAASATGVKILAATPNAKVFVDGADKGTLPAELKDIAPGSHKLRFEAGDRYEKLEQSVDVEAGKMKEIGPIKLKVLKGQVALELATEGATVKLVDEKKTEKKVPESELKKGPVKIELDPTKSWKIVATKKGMDDFSQDVSFDDGVAEKTVRIDLSDAAKNTASGSVASGSATGSATGSDNSASGSTTGSASTTTDKSAGGGDKTPPAAAGGTGTLNINSIPVSKVVLDGKPLGSTPKVGVSVPAGSHTVMFIHPDKGKQSVTVTVKAGETKTAAVKFK
jgi:serine/threonine-protein kinase